MSNHLNPQQAHDWHEALDAVEQIAANTDTESGSKAYIETMAQFVRDEPHAVVKLLTLV